MPKIHLLSAHEAQKIAAGEVVERPANVVKELIENAIDAQATVISVYIEDGGKYLIRIEDNGCGMDEEDAQLCFAHHATSKIKTVDDLQKLQTFGFRGEALSSIAAVSSITLITKTAQATQALKIEVDAGTLQPISYVAANQGTDIAVRNIFDNIPARKKFLKTADTEWRQIQQLFQAFCLDYLSIHFKLYSHDKLVLNCPITDDIHQRITQIWGSSFASNMIDLESVADSSMHISGAISNHQYARYDRNNIFFFVNSRWVKQHKLASALIKGYLNVIPPARYPAACIFISVDPQEVDINIHPRKEEVQFLHPRKVEQLLAQAAKQTLQTHVSSQIKKPITFAPAFQVASVSSSGLVGLQFEPMQKIKFESKITQFDFDASPFNHLNISANNVSSEIGSALPSITHTQATIAHTPSETTSYNYIGQFKKTYLLLEKDDGLFIVDQHAAHERILYELFAHKFDQVATVKLLFPQIITLRAEDIKTLEPHLNFFAHNGIAIEVFSEQELVIQATPVHLKNQSVEDLINNVLSWIKEFAQTDQAQFAKIINEKLHAQMACKAAVKAGDSLSSEQIKQLLDDLHKVDNRFTCPHGRPTCWLLNINDIEKKFKRKV